MNYWFWMFLIIIPMFVFSIQPESSRWLRTGRLLLASCVGYVLIHLFVNWNFEHDSHIFEVCQNQFADGGTQQHAECGEPPNATPLGFLLVFGLIPSATYVGLWEFVWHRYYRQRIRNLGPFLKGKYTSAIVRTLAMACGMYISLLLIVLTVDIARAFYFQYHQ